MSVEKEDIRTEIKFNTEIIKVLAAFIALTIGGVLTLLIEGVDKGVEYALTIIGLGVGLIFIRFAIFVYLLNKKLLNELKNHDKNGI